MSEDKSKLQLIGEIAQANNKNLELIVELNDREEEIERLNKKEEQLIRRLEDLIIVGEQVENEWAVDICKMIIEELKGSDK